jgi:hypothetical protein
MPSKAAHVRDRHDKQHARIGCIKTADDFFAGGDHLLDADLAADKMMPTQSAARPVK